MKLKLYPAVNFRLDGCSFSKEGAEFLFQLITKFYEKKSLIVTSNLEFSQWNRIFTDSILTAPLVGRLIHLCGREL